MKDIIIYCLTVCTVFFAAAWGFGPGPTPAPAALAPPWRAVPEVWPPTAPAMPGAPTPAPAAPARQGADLGPLWDAMWAQEASRRYNPPDGDVDHPKGPSIGPYQIMRGYWEDSRVPGRWEDCRDIEYARQVMLAYWRRYVPEALAAGDYEVLARTHNGGPRGAQRPATLGYWKKVEAYLAAK